MVGESNGDAHFPFNQYLDEKEIKRIIFPALKISKLFAYARECRHFYETNKIDILHVHNPITAFIHNYYARKMVFQLGFTTIIVANFQTLG